MNLGVFWPYVEAFFLGDLSSSGFCGSSLTSSGFLGSRGDFFLLGLVGVGSEVLWWSRGDLGEVDRGDLGEIFLPSCWRGDRGEGPGEVMSFVGSCGEEPSITALIVVIH